MIQTKNTFFGSKIGIELVKFKCDSSHNFIRLKFKKTIRLNRHKENVYVMIS
ncbi:hypothetical protein LEP1GSC077_0283 [Leptospira interrogans str. C10069]|nr:hypothetical protein LEP1GSC077_0283 [Leptospira interrogans str. C10069]